MGLLPPLRGWAREEDTHSQGLRAGLISFRRFAATESREAA